MLVQTFVSYPPDPLRHFDEEPPMGPEEIIIEPPIPDSGPEMSFMLTSNQEVKKYSFV